MGMTFKCVFAAVALLLCFVGVAAATIYRWTDERGVVHFSDDYEKIPARYRAKARVESGATPSIIPSDKVVQPRQESSPPRAESGDKDRVPPEHARKKEHHRKHRVKAPAVPVTPARQAQQKVEEQIRRDRQSIDDARLPARKAQERAEEQIRKAREGTMGH